MRKLKSLQLLSATPQPNLRNAWDAEMRNGAIVFIGWTNESEFNVNGNLEFCRILNKLHPSNDKQGGKRRILNIQRLLTAGHHGYLLLADGDPGEIRNSIRDEFYRVSLVDLPNQVNVIPINKSSLINWRIERRKEFDDDVEAKIKVRNYSQTEKEALVMSRRGQGLFRQRVLINEPCCRLTGVDESQFLRASHIKPWAESDDRERLDGSNGLMLAPHVDHLFDFGFISFRQSGELLVADEAMAVVKKWKLCDSAIGGFSGEQEIYLRYHREHIFRSNLYY